jgi:hypothetical protein
MLGVWKANNKNIIAGTAAYAAVLVVFVVDNDVMSDTTFCLHFNNGKTLCSLENNRSIKQASGYEHTMKKAFLGIAAIL